MKVLFDVTHYYYLPQFEPVISELIERGVDAHCVTNITNKAYLDSYQPSKQYPFIYLDNNRRIEDIINETSPDWVFFGHTKFRGTDIPQTTKFALMQHGVGPKKSYIDAPSGDFDVVFVEGQKRVNKLLEHYPDKNLVNVGFAKMDPLIRGSLKVPDLQSLGLDPDKKTILFAPSFFPSSILSLPKNFPDLIKQYNLILKPHFFTLQRKKFQKQKKHLEYWAKQKNVYLAPISDVNVLYYYQLADILISEASSTIFEFIALDKPVIWFNCYNLHWGYRGPFKYRLKKRMDFDMHEYKEIGANSNSVDQLLKHIDFELNNPGHYSAARVKLSGELLGDIDGQVSQRIANYLISKK